MRICDRKRVSEIVLKGNLNQADASVNWEAMLVIHLLWSGKQVSISGDSSKVVKIMMHLMNLEGNFG